MTHIFFEYKLIAKEYNVANGGFGSCEIFIKTDAYKVPSNVQTILEKKQLTSNDYESPINQLRKIKWKCFDLAIGGEVVKQRSAKPKHSHIIIRLMTIIEVPIIIVTECNPLWFAG